MFQRVATVICHLSSALCLLSSTTVESSLQINFFMQNKANFPENQVNASPVLAKGYEADIVFWPKNPKPNLRKAQMNVSIFSQMAYENKRNWTLGENEPNQSQLKPIQTQYKANFTPIMGNVSLIYLFDF